MPRRDRSGIVFSGIVTSVVVAPVLWLVWPTSGVAEEVSPSLTTVATALQPDLPDLSSPEGRIRSRCRIAFTLPKGEPITMGELGVGVRGLSDDVEDGVGINCVDMILGTQEAIETFRAKAMQFGDFRAAGPANTTEHEGHLLIDQLATTADGGPARVALWVTPASAVSVVGSGDSVRQDVDGNSRFDTIVSTLRYVGGPAATFSSVEIKSGDLGAQIKEQHARANLAGRRHVLQFSADGCPPCRVFKENIHHPRIEKSLEGIHLTVVDFDVFGDFATALEVSSVPTWLELDADGKFTDHRLSGGWDEDTPESMAPVLAEFFAGLDR